MIIKNVLKIVAVLFIGLTLFTCNKEESVIGNNGYVEADKKIIAKLIKSFDATLNQVSSSDKVFDEEEINKVFLEEISKNGISNAKHNSPNTLAKKSISYKFSTEFNLFAIQIGDAQNFPSQEAYKDFLTDLESQVQNSNIALIEKQILVNHIAFTCAFVDWTESLVHSQSPKTLYYAKTRLKSSNVEEDKKSWWQRWDKCAAGITGSALTGLVTGCGIGAATGALITAPTGPGVV